MAYNPFTRLDTSIDGKEIWFDNIIFTDLDTATVLKTGTLGISANLRAGDKSGLKLFPNPITNSATVSYFFPENGPVRIYVYNINGRKIAELVNKSLPKGYDSMQWPGEDENGNIIPEGLNLFFKEDWKCRSNITSYGHDFESSWQSLCH